MIKMNINELLEKNGKSKYWLCQNMNITTRNLNRIIRGETTSISFKYIEKLCELLKCTPNDLFEIKYSSNIINKNTKIEV
ncbi:MAG: helix-turn-helix transcriptional regulator [Bacilli bacterium]|nr:helix-turn-helix transcriptional regulator [Bacilli bacterium]